MKKFALTLAIIGNGTLLAIALPTQADELKPLNVAMTEGTYAGTFLCSLGEMGMSLTLKDAGPATVEDIHQPLCASATGTCNDRQKIEIDNSRKVSGFINFFPTVGNPEAPAGAFEVSGSVNYTLPEFKRLQLVPGKWLDKPDGFGASAMTGTIYKNKISGKPTAQGCHELKLTKIQTWTP